MRGLAEGEKVPAADAQQTTPVQAPDESVIPGAEPAAPAQTPEPQIPESPAPAPTSAPAATAR